VTIVVCASALALAGLPQLHECLHHAGARPGHGCAVVLLAKYIKGIQTKVVVVAAPVVAPITIQHEPSPTWVTKLFLEACRNEHGPPVFLTGALS
jgi:hypothetical protein